MNTSKITFFKLENCIRLFLRRFVRGRNNCRDAASVAFVNVSGLRYRNLHLSSTFGFSAGLLLAGKVCLH
jgi:hypothetical protein